MPLSPGEKIGPYEILAPLGAGGMGEVYRARDPRLNRDVAIKISAERFNERFEREARAIAALNHPNICQVYDVGASPSGFGYLVMELIEGDSPKGPFPLETALKYAAQIAEALEAAHEKGIVHRDLKPANIRITPGGIVKVLDFGLAKVATPAPGGMNENSPTLSMGMTQAGVILGTAAYMAPEQARGEPVDKRADIWAFGVVVYEMLAGERMYAGKTVSDVLAAVLIKEPDLEKVPQAVRRMLRRCLEKDPKDRLRDIADAMPLVDPESPATPAAAAPAAHAHHSKNPWLVAALFFLTASAAGYEWWRATQPVDHPMVRLDVDLGDDVALQTPNGTSNVVLSPDASRLVYFASVKGAPAKLYLRRFDQANAVEVSGSEGANSPIFSPDGRWIGFTTATRFNKVSVEGGAPIALGDTGPSTGTSWGDDGNIVQTVLLQSIVRYPSAGGAPVKLMELAPGELTFAAPQVLPGSKGALFDTYRTPIQPENANLEILNLADHKRKVVAQGGLSPRYVPASAHSGYLLYANKNVLFAASFDPDRMERRGEAIPILEDLGFNSATFEAQFDVSPSGALVYRKATGTASGPVSLQWVDAAGKRTSISKPGSYFNPRLSPDEKKLAVTVLQGGSQDIQIYDIQRETWSDLTSNTSRLFNNPVWTPDGRYVVFSSFTGLLWSRSDGATQPQKFFEKQVIEAPGSFSPDGKRLAFAEVGGGNISKVFTMSIDNSDGQLKGGTPEPFLKDNSVTFDPAFSPDGKWLAYGLAAANAVGDIFVRSFPDSGGQWKISDGGAQNPIWSRTGHELLYQQGDQEIAVSYSVKGDTFVAEKPRVWLDKVGGQAFDLSADGKRLLILAPSGANGAVKPEHEVVLIQNFVDELRRRVPGGK